MHMAKRKIIRIPLPRKGKIIPREKLFSKRNKTLRQWMMILRGEFHDLSTQKLPHTIGYWMNEVQVQALQATVHERTLRKKSAHQAQKLIAKGESADAVNSMMGAKVRVDYLLTLLARTPEERAFRIRKLKKTIDEYEKIDCRLRKMLGQPIHEPD